MAGELQLGDEEMTQLHLLLSQDVAASRLELRHMSGRPYREYVKQRVKQGEALLRKLEHALPSLRKGNVN